MKNVKIIPTKNKLFLVLLSILVSCYQRTEPVGKESLQGKLGQLHFRSLNAGRNNTEVNFYYLDVDGDEKVDTIKVVNTLYGPGIRQTVLFCEVAAREGVPDKAYYLMSDFSLVRNNREISLIKTEKSEMFMSFPPLPIDSFVLKPLIGRVGFRIENICVETVPEINYLEVAKMGSAYHLCAYGRINVSRESYIERYPNDTCEAIINELLDNSKRISFKYLEDMLDSEKWRCFGSRAYKLNGEGVLEAK